MKWFQQHFGGHLFCATVVATLVCASPIASADDYAAILRANMRGAESGNVQA